MIYPGQVLNLPDHPPATTTARTPRNARSTVLTTSSGNAKAAVIISDNGTNTHPWTTFTSGAYLGRC